MEDGGGNRGKKMRMRRGGRERAVRRRQKWIEKTRE